MEPDGHLHIVPDVTIPADRVSFTYSRSSGPGGQNVNKLNTRVTVELHLDDLADRLSPGALHRLTRLAGPALLTADRRLRITSDTHRSQRANREACLDRLRQLILRARVVPKRRKKTRPTRGAVEKRLQRKKHRGQIKRRRREDLG